MWHRFALAGMALVALTIACSNDNPVKPGPSGPLFSIMVRDSAGAPVENVEVGRINQSPYLTDRPVHPQALPSTGIDFALPTAAEITLTIFDYYGDTVAQVWDHEELSPGSHSIDVDFPNPGFYRYELIADSDTTIRWMVAENAYDHDLSIISSTDSSGIFTTDDTLLFPCLLGAPPMIYISSMGVVVDSTHDYYTDSVMIIVRDATTARIIEAELKVGRNAFEVTWP